MTEDERAIREVVQAWMQATREGDLTTVLSLMTDDVVFMVPGQEPFGKEAFASASAEMSDVKIESKSEVLELKVLGDWAYLRSKLKVTVTPPDGSPRMSRSGFTLTLFRKEEGKWRLSRDANLLTPDE